MVDSVGVGEELLQRGNYHIVEAAMAAKPGQLKFSNGQLFKCSIVQMFKLYGIISRCSKPYKSNVHPISGTFLYSSGSPRS